ncbi:DUF6059 family protein [Streptomyces sp. NPDC048521]|uniref:DUF6059 family protein n=1 Tax=Streptomyces sp. NPDC048521 TaxID=3365566 RepID=UPI00371D5A34
MWHRLLRPRRVGRAIYRALSAFGMLHTGPHPEAEPLAGPAPGHPERLCADVPLTPLERRLVRELGVG